MQMQLVEVIGRMNASQFYISSFIIFGLYKVIGAKNMLCFGNYIMSDGNTLAILTRISDLNILYCTESDKLLL
jgi:hypothetical protein